MFTHLHVRSWFSFLAGGSSPEDLALAAHQLGQPALALTDIDGVYGAVRFQQACRRLGIRSIIGSELSFDGAPLVLLAEDRHGYANLCQLLTLRHVREKPLALADLRRHRDGLFCLSGGVEGHLWALARSKHLTEALAWLHTFLDIYGPRLHVELVNHLRPDDRYATKTLATLAHELRVPVIATNDVRYARPGDYCRYDLLTCARLGITVHEPHPARPSNAEAYLKGEEAMRGLIPCEEAHGRTAALAESCTLDLLREQVHAPSARVPDAHSPDQQLARLCLVGLQRKYERATYPAALRQLNRELAVIADLQLEEFFLVVHEVVREAQRRAIRYAGRGSAANSIVAYLLDITGVDPIRHNLLFERFLHRGRKGTPDIDIDFDSERRDEIIAWIEERFGLEHTAMTATVITFRLRLALREAAKALGFPMQVIDRLSKAVPPREPRQVREFLPEIRSVFTSPRLEQLLDIVESLQDCPRHLGLHNGGMVLSEWPLCHFSPVQVSKNGVKVVQFDKDDIEALGLIKLDVLGLRMFSTLSEAEEMIGRHFQVDIDLDELPLDEPEVFAHIRTSKTLGLFQIESQGQMHLIASLRPECFDDIINEIALFRPGPLQGDMVHPFVRRRRGQEAVAYDHPDLEPILADTYGVILFQEQILEIAHQFAGMPLQAADDFRSAMSKYRESAEMSSMRSAFVGGAVRRGVAQPAAEQVFDKVSKFVGYGFCRSHAAAFARTVYQSAWLKCHHPGPYMAAVMQARPGMYPQQTLEEEAKRLGYPMLMPDINRSGLRFDMEWTEGRWHIRKPLASVREVSEDTARRLAWARMDGPFTNLEDLFHRVVVPRKALEGLARAGALDGLSGSSRRALWAVGVMAQRANKLDAPAFLPPPLINADEMPDLPPLTLRERVLWDLKSHEAGRLHPLSLVRRQLNDLGAQTIQTCYRIAAIGHEPHVTVAGTALLKQMPPTAKGVMFITLEDETGYIQVVVFANVQQQFVGLIREASLIVEGRLQANGQWRGVVADKLYPLRGAFGGYAGYPSAHGQDRRDLGDEPERVALPPARQMEA
jgi:error-prone DNA polymerase